MEGRWKFGGQCPRTSTMRKVPQILFPCLRASSNASWCWSVLRRAKISKCRQKGTVPNVSHLGSICFSWESLLVDTLVTRVANLGTFAFLLVPKLLPNFFFMFLFFGLYFLIFSLPFLSWSSLSEFMRMLGKREAPSKGKRPYEKPCLAQRLQCLSGTARGQGHWDLSFCWLQAKSVVFWSAWTAWTQRNAKGLRIGDFRLCFKEKRFASASSECICMFPKRISDALGSGCFSKGSGNEESLWFGKGRRENCGHVLEVKCLAVRF